MCSVGVKATAMGRFDGKKLKRARESAGYSQDDLASLCSALKPFSLTVSKGAIGLWERGARSPGFDRLRKVARALSVSVDTFLT